MTSRWIRSPDDNLVWEIIGQASFVYHPASGQTHYLNELGAWILNHLGVVPLSPEEICADLVASFDSESTPELSASVHSTVRVLAGLGLLQAKIADR